MTINPRSPLLGATARVAAVELSRAQASPSRSATLNFRLAAVIYPSLVRRAPYRRRPGIFRRRRGDVAGAYVRPLLLVLCGAAGANTRDHLSLFGADFRRYADSLSSC